MSEYAFEQQARATLDAVEASLERLVDSTDLDLDLDLERQGNVITLTFADDSQLIVNSHSSAGEIWVAARSGGFHYRRVNEGWVDGRSGEELFAALSRLVSLQSGATVQLAPPG